jgi:hypothetical protein
MHQPDIQTIREISGPVLVLSGSKAILEFAQIYHCMPR